MSWLSKAIKRGSSAPQIGVLTAAAAGAVVGGAPLVGILPAIWKTMTLAQKRQAVDAQTAERTRQAQVKVQIEKALPPPPAAGMSTQTLLLIGGGAAVLLAMVYMVKMRGRRR